MLGWLLRVTRNACVDALRKRRSYRKFIATDTEQVALAAGSMPATDAAAESAIFRQHLDHALDQLSEPYRSIIVLREIQELKYEEISGALNLPLNTVKVYLHRARKMLRNHLREVLHRETV
jgi:RNA polymerase sigma-70 factor (ECF subfamily)